MSFFPPYGRSKNKIEVELNWSKSDLKNASTHHSLLKEMV